MRDAKIGNILLDQTIVIERAKDFGQFFRLTVAPFEDVSIQFHHGVGIAVRNRERRVEYKNRKRATVRLCQLDNKVNSDRGLKIRRLANPAHFFVNAVTDLMDTGGTIRAVDQVTNRVKCGRFPPPWDWDEGKRINRKYNRVGKRNRSIHVQPFCYPIRKYSIGVANHDN